MTYRLYCADLSNSTPNAAMTVDVVPSSSFIFDPANTDYQQFKSDIANGVELQDVDGVAMTAEQVQAFLETLP